MWVLSFLKGKKSFDESLQIDILLRATLKEKNLLIVFVDTDAAKVNAITLVISKASDSIGLLLNIGL